MSETHQLVKIDVGVYPKFDPAGECWPVDKSATKDWDASDSTVTEACLTALGFFIPQSRSQKLKWCYKAKTFRSDFLVVALADTDVVFGSADCERIKVADDEKSSFPILPSKKSAEEKKDHEREKDKIMAQQQLQKDKERKEKLKIMRPPIQN